ncbi:hypothetical protein ACWGII_41115 [Streptomyces sp. NPDC054855]
MFLDLRVIEVFSVKASLREAFNLADEREEPDQNVLAFLSKAESGSVPLGLRRGLPTPPFAEKRACDADNRAKQTAAGGDDVRPDIHNHAVLGSDGSCGSSSREPDNMRHSPWSL